MTSSLRINSFSGKKTISLHIVAWYADIPNPYGISLNWPKLGIKAFISYIYLLHFCQSMENYN